MPGLDHAFFGVDPSDETFDLRVAQRTFLWMRDGGPEAELVAKFAVFEGMQADIAAFKPDIQDTITAWGAERIAKALHGLEASEAEAVSKGLEPTLANAVREVLESISKADDKKKKKRSPLPDEFDDTNDWWEGPGSEKEPGPRAFPLSAGSRARESREEHQASAKRQARGPGGRWITMSRRIDYDIPRVGESRAKAMGLRQLIAPSTHPGGAPNPLAGKPLAPSDQAAYHKAWVQLQEMAGSLNDTGAVHSVELYLAPVPYTIPGEHGRPIKISGGQTLVVTGDHVPTQDELADAHEAGYRLAGITATVDPDLSLGGAAFDLATGLGASPETAGHVVGTTARGLNNPEALKSFAEKWNERGSASEPRAQAYSRLNAAAGAAQALAPPTTTPQVRTGLAVAQWAGKNGQQVENLIGPTTERTAYRFRGTEKVPDPGLQADLRFIRANYPDVNGSRGGKRARDLFVLGPMGRRGEELKVQRANGQMTEGSPVRDYLEGKLPDPSRVDLHLESGRNTPSQGILINERGQIVSESVGMGEDHYLPFTPRAMRELPGGEYARTRVFGGPTVEDFYAGLVGGARAFTVVSNSGTYSVEFAPDFRGARRYNDKAARMLQTYQGLLDSLQAEVVGFEIPEDRMAELRAEAKRDVPNVGGRSLIGSGSARADKLEQLTEDELDDPQLSQNVRNQLFAETLQAVADKAYTGTGEPMDVDTLVSQWEARDENHPEERMRWEEAMEPRNAMADPEGANLAREKFLSQVGGASAHATFNRKVADAERTRLNETRKMRLDGRGYYEALQAMQEQFPYYIAAVHYIPREGKEAVKDKGYTRPGDTRPVAARIGFHNAPNSRVGRGQEANSAEPRKKSAAELYGRRGNVGRTRSREADNEDRRPTGRGRMGRSPFVMGDRPGGSGRPEREMGEKDYQRRAVNLVSASMRRSAEAGTLKGDFADAGLQTVGNADVVDNALREYGFRPGMSSSELKKAQEAMTASFPGLNHHPEIGPMMHRLAAVYGGGGSLEQVRQEFIDAAENEEWDERALGNLKAAAAAANLGGVYKPGADEQAQAKAFQKLHAAGREEGIVIPDPTQPGFDEGWTDAAVKVLKGEAGNDAQNALDVLIRSYKLGLVLQVEDEAMANATARSGTRRFVRRESETPSDSEGEREARVTRSRPAPTTVGASEPPSFKVPSFVEDLPAGFRAEPARETVPPRPAAPTPSTDTPRGVSRSAIEDMMRVYKDPKSSAGERRRAREWLEGALRT